MKRLIKPIATLTVSVAVLLIAVNVFLISLKMERVNHELVIQRQLYKITTYIYGRQTDLMVDMTREIVKLKNK